MPNIADIAQQLNVPESEIESVSINWTAPASRVAVFYGPDANIKKIFYTVILRSGEIRSLDSRPSETEIFEYVKENFPDQLYWFKSQ